MDIITNCFSGDSSKAVRKIGLYKLQPLLNDFKKLYMLYIDALTNAGPEEREIILSDEPFQDSFQFGSGNFTYNLESNI